MHEPVAPARDDLKKRPKKGDKRGQKSDKRGQKKVTKKETVGGGGQGEGEAQREWNRG